MSDHDCTKHLEYDFATTRQWSCIIRCWKCGQKWYPQWMVKDLAHQLRNAEKETQFPTPEDARGYGVACLDLEVVTKRLDRRIPLPS